MRIQHKAFAVIAAMLCSTLAWADSTTLGEISEAAKRSGDKSVSYTHLTLPTTPYV